MAKAVVYIKKDQVGSLLLTYTGTDTQVDNQWTNILATGSLLDGTLLRFAKRYNPAYIEVNGACTSGTVAAGDTWGGTAPPTAPGITEFTAGSPAVGAATTIHAAVTLTGIAQTVTTAITNPDVCRVLSITGNASGIAGNVVISGLDIGGTAVTDTIALNGSATVNGVIAFKTVTSVLLPAKTNSSGDTISIGTTSALGLPTKLSVNSVIAAYRNSVKEGTPPTIATSLTVLGQNTAILSSALNGTPIRIDYYN